MLPRGTRLWLRSSTASLQQKPDFRVGWPPGGQEAKKLELCRGRKHRKSHWMETAAFGRGCDGRFEVPSGCDVGQSRIFFPMTGPNESAGRVPLAPHRWARAEAGSRNGRINSKKGRLQGETRCWAGFSRFRAIFFFRLLAPPKREKERPVFSAHGRPARKAAVVASHWRRWDLRPPAPPK